MKRIGFVLLLVCGCLARPPKRRVLGRLPKAVTSASPQWIPWRIGAGKPMVPQRSEVRLKELRRLTFDGHSMAPRWHPNGRQLLIQQSDANRACAKTLVIDLSHGRQVPWDSNRVALGHDPQGTVLAATTTLAKPTPCSPVPGQPGWAQAPADVLFQPLRAKPSSNKALSIAAAGDAFVHGPSNRLLYRSLYQGNFEIYAVNRDGSSRKRLSNSPGYDGQPQLAPNGAMAVWTSQAAAAKPPAAASATSKKEATPKKSSLSTPSPEASKNPAASARALPFQLVLASSSGDKARNLTAGNSNHVDPMFLHDSRHLLFSSDQNRRNPIDYDIYVMDTLAAPGSNAPPPQRLTYGAGYDGQPAISPDGRWIAFTSDRGGNGFDVYVARYVDDAGSL